jgi:hypothetical protein
LAVVADVSLATIGMMESGQRGNKGKIPGTLPQIAKALGVNFDWLAYGTEPMTTDAPATHITYDDDLSALRTVYMAVAPEFRVAALSAATMAVISFLSPHTTVAHDQHALDTNKSAARRSSPALRKTP